MNDTQHIDKYMAEARSYPLLTVKEEKECATIIRRFKGGKQKQEAREKLVNGNLRLVVKYAHVYHSQSSVSINELIGAGNLGLIKAVDNFDPQKFKTKFSTFAVYWIKQGIFKAIYLHNDAVHIPIHIVNGAWKHNKLKHLKFSDEKIAKELDVSAEGLKRIKQSNRYLFSLDQEVFDNSTSGGGRAVRWEEMISDKNNSLPDEALEKKEMREMIDETLNELKPLYKDLIVQRFFMGGKENYQTTAKKYGCTGEAIRQHLDKALKSFKFKIKNKMKLD